MAKVLPETQQNVIDVNTVYTVTNQMEMYPEQSRWSRFNTFLFTESIILASWVMLFSSARDLSKILLYLMPFVGALLGLVWFMLGKRSGKYQNEMHNAAKKLESCIKVVSILTILFTK